MDAVGIDRLDGGVGALMAELVPDGDPGHRLAVPARSGGAGVPAGVGRRRQGDDGPATLGRFADRVPQARHPEPDLGWARVDRAPGTDVEELVPDAHPGDRSDRAEARRPSALQLEPLAPDPRPEDRLGREHADVRVTGRDRAADRVHRDQRPGREPAHHDRPDVDRPAIVLEPRGDVGEVLTGEVGDRVEHVGTGIEQEPAARQRQAAGARCLRSASPSPARRPR